jgi:Cof subfamily protein (haloacid dehalogenase superfamily)
MLNDIRLIIFDLDGTLLDSEKRIPESAFESLQKIKDNGVYISIATGRPLYSTLPYINQLALKTYFSVSDSSIVLNSDGDVISQSWIDASLMQQVGERAHNQKCGLVWATNRGMTDDFLIHESDFSDQFMRDFITVESKIYGLEMNLLKIKREFSFDDLKSYMVFILGLKSDIAILDSDLKHFKGQVTFLSHIGLNKVYHQELVKTHELIILRPLGADKSRGVKAIAAKHGVDLSQTMFFGDWYNDIEALDSVGYPVLMGNAPDELKKDGYHITDSNDENGIVHALEYYGLI